MPFERMPTWGLNTCLYAPKEDLKHRAFRRQSYPTVEVGELAELIRACRPRNLRFFYLDLLLNYIRLKVRNRRRSEGRISIRPEPTATGRRDERSIPKQG